MRSIPAAFLALVLLACSPPRQAPAVLATETEWWRVERLALDNAEAALLEAIDLHAGASAAESEVRRRAVEERHLAVRILLERLRLLELDRTADVHAGRGDPGELSQIRQERERRLARLAEIERRLPRESAP